MPVPRVCPTLQGLDVGGLDRDGVDYAACLLSFLPGRLLADSTPDAAMLQGAGGVLARLDHALRGFFHPTLNRRLAWDVRRLPELIEFGQHVESPDLRHAIERASAGIGACGPRLRSLRSQAIHGDCHAKNCWWMLRRGP